MIDLKSFVLGLFVMALASFLDKPMYSLMETLRKKKRKKG